MPTSNPASWHTEDAATGTHWQAWTDLFSGIPTGSMLSLAGIAAANPGKTVDRVYLTEGMGNSYHAGANGTAAWVDKARIGDLTYDFVVSCPNPNAVGGLVDVVTGGSGSGGSMGLSWLLAGLVAITAVSGGGLWTLLRRRS